MIRTILSVLTCSLSVISYAQEIGEISGKVLDKNKHPLEFVSVFITNKADSSKVVGGTIRLHFRKRII